MLLLLGLQEFPERAVCTGVLPSLGMQSAALLVSAAAKRQWQVLGKRLRIWGAQVIARVHLPLNLPARCLHQLPRVAVPPVIREHL